MKKLLLLLLCFPMIGFGQQTYVPDDNFEQALINQGYDNVLDDYVLTSNIDILTYLDVSNQNIYDLTGIEDFTNLTYLECYNNQLTSLDISQNIIDYLICYNNQIMSINLNTNLYLLDCWNNNLTNLDVSNNPNLVYLYAQGNQLTSIDLTANIALIELRLDYNQLTSLDLSNNINLEYLDFYDSQITSIDLSQNIYLIELRCGYNQLSSLDLSQNTNLEYLYCQNNLIASIDLTQSTNLSLIYCNDNQITDLIIDSDSLKELYCGNNPISIFDATIHNNLEMLEIYNTGIYNIDLSQNQNLWFLSIGSNPDLWSLDLSNNTNLEHLDLYSNSLSNLDMRNGNNQNMSYFVTWNCWNSQFLDCISVDDSTYSTNNWTSIDSWHYFGNNCNPLAIQEHTTNKELLKVTDLLGREKKGTKNAVLFYIYDDGTVEKRIVVE